MWLPVLDIEGSRPWKHRFYRTSQSIGSIGPRASALIPPPKLQLSVGNLDNAGLLAVHAINNWSVCVLFLEERRKIPASASSAAVLALYCTFQLQMYS